ncbi:hypothetical protein [Spirosoma validum]|uniref:Uncharacterized protein n=1 Tax=Spirosoma validum TaxID=2771355 RepID=A0A927B5G3_9BACT|nr:hypothetical protein [Spirosoma validum]MBD2755790.1 hypothetical protein [Spirosoma validum]
METVIGIGFYIPSNENDYISFDSRGSLSDADIVVFNPDFQNTEYRYDHENSSFQGKRLYGTDSSFEIKEHSNHWQNEILNALKSGKTIFITLTEKVDFFVHTGQKNTSGTGRNQKVTDIVDSYHNYKFLPSLGFNIVASTGSKIFIYSNLVRNLYECCKDYFEFQAYINSKEEIKYTLFSTKSKDKILGLSTEITNGHLIFIPAINLPDSFSKEDNEWTDEAYIWGKRFKQVLSEISKSLKTTKERTPQPEWSHNEDFNLLGSISTKQLIIESRERLLELENNISDLEQVLKEQESLKDLLFETGKALEHAVIKALKILGYFAEGYNDGRLELDQIIISPEGERFIGECEGKDNKDVDVSKFRQLLDSLNEDFDREEVSEKADGILFGNPQRLIKPSDRTLDFTDKCKRGAEREKIALIKTYDLFIVSRYVLETNDEAFKLECRLAIKDQLGKVVKFPKIEDVERSLTAILQ